MWPAEYPQLWFTYGPKTRDYAILRDLLVAGATGARLTFSYGTHDLQAERARQLRRVANEIGCRIFLVADLQGEKCRFAAIEGIDEIPVRRDSNVLLASSKSDTRADPIVLQVQVPSYIDEMLPGDVIVEGDGGLLLEVLRRDKRGAVCRVLLDGVIHPGRGIVLRKKDFRPNALTAKDQNDLTFVIQSGLFDAVAISFVGMPQDILQTRLLMSQTGGSLSVIAKIETQLGVENVVAIAEEADAVMAARGDLALTMPWEELPISVMKIAKAAATARKPWILATQIAEGIERFSLLTRAEICDLAHWVGEGAAVVMLSYETAFGRAPIDAIGAVNRMLKRFAQH